MTRRQRRMLFVGLGTVTVAVVVGLMLQVFQSNLMYFHTPTEVLDGQTPAGARFRLGGVVVAGSVERDEGSLAVRFGLADCENRLEVEYEGILPDLFREGQGVVMTGRVIQAGRFRADEVLAKHDENYMPPELAESLTTDTGHSCAPFKSMQRS